MFNSIRKFLVIFSVFFSLNLPVIADVDVANAGVANAETPEEKGLAIAKEIELRDRGFSDSTSNITMKLRDRYGNERPRYMRNKTLEQEGDGDKSIIIFDNPGDVKGTAFLSFTHKVGPDSQWLKLSRLPKPKRISSSNKAGAFMNSEFSFEDIASQEVEKYTYKYLKDEVLDGVKCFVSESDPVDPKSGYSKIVSWVDQERYIPLKLEFYDRGGSHKKTLVFKEYNQYLNKYWRAHNWNMENHQTGKSTQLIMDNWAFKTGLRDRDFHKNSLANLK